MAAYYESRWGNTLTKNRIFDETITDDKNDDIPRKVQAYEVLN